MRPLCLLFLVACGGGKVTAKVSTDTPPDPQPTATAEAAPPPPPPRQEVTFGSKPMGAGTSLIFRGTSGTNLIASIDRGGVRAMGDFLLGETVERKYEVLESTGPSISRAKVTAVRIDREHYESGHISRPKSAIAGKTYVVTRRPDDVLVITTDRGAKVTDKEGNEIANEFGAFFRVPQTPVPAGAMKVGDSSEAIADVLRAELIAGAPGPVGFHQLSATLTGTRDCAGATCAVFALRIDISAVVRQVEIRHRLDGEILVSTADGFPREMSASGVVFVNGARGYAEGTARMRATWSQP